MSTSSRPQTSNKVALVTGSSRGIGKAIALRLARDGYDVAINDLGSKQEGIDAAVKEIQGLGRKSIGVVADVSSSEETDALVAKVVEALGSLDCMVSNAGIAQVKPLIETTEADRKGIVNVNFLGLMNSHISAAKQMIRQGKGGRIIGAASVAGYQPGPMLVPYSATKWAIRGFTTGAAKEWAQYGIRVNAYAPGIVDTPMLAESMGTDRETTLKNIGEANILLKRLSVPEDVAKLVSFLASDDAEYITGQTMIVDGGIAFA